MPYIIFTSLLIIHTNACPFVFPSLSFFDSTHETLDFVASYCLLLLALAVLLNYKIKRVAPCFLVYFYVSYLSHQNQSKQAQSPQIMLICWHLEIALHPQFLQLMLMPSQVLFPAWSLIDNLVDLLAVLILFRCISFLSFKLNLPYNTSY